MNYSNDRFFKKSILFLIESKKIETTRLFDMSLDGPSVAVVDELLTIQIVLINNQPNELEAEVIMPSSAHYSLVHLDKHHNYRATRVRSTLRHQVYLAAKSSRRVPIPIVAFEAGRVQVLVIGRCLAAQVDRTIIIEVESSGVPVEMYTNQLIDLRQETELTGYFYLNATRNSMNAKATICFLGDVVGAPQISENSDNPIDFTSLGK